MDKETLLVRAENPKNGFSNHNFNQWGHIELDYAECKVELREESKNSYGIAHGGAMYAIADNAAGMAAHTDGRSYVTQSSTMNFIGNQSEGTLRAEARVRKRGKTITLVDVTILGDGDRLLGTGMFTFFCVDRKKFEAEENKTEA